MSLELDFVKKQLEAERSLRESELVALEEDARVRDLEFELKMQSDAEKKTMLEERLAKAEGRLMGGTKELLALKQAYKKATEEVDAKIVVAKGQQGNLQSQDEAVRRRALVETENLQRISELRSEDIIERFRKQTMRVTEKLKRAKKDHAALQNMFDSRVRDLEKTLERCLERKRTLEKNDDADRM